MKVTLVNGSPHPHGCTNTALMEVAGELEKEGISTTIFNIGTKPVYGCIACNKCIDTGRCIFNDDPCNEMIELLKNSDGMVIGSPVYYASPNGVLLSLLDRVFFLKKHFYRHKPAAAVVSSRRSGTTAAFEVLTKYFTINEMPVVSSQYWNAVHGYTADDARKDIEGMQCMRTLGRNMAWMLKSFEAAKDKVARPEFEKVTHTNFIR